MEEEDLNLSLLLESTFAFWFSHPSHLTLTSGWLLRVPTQNVGWYLFIHFLFVFLLHSTPKQPIKIKEESRNTDTRPSKKRQHILFLLLPQPPSSKKGITKYPIHYCQQHYFESGKIYSTNRCWRSYGRIGADCFTTLRKKVNSINYTLGKLNFVWC